MLPTQLRLAFPSYEHLHFADMMASSRLLATTKHQGKTADHDKAQPIAGQID